jgi:ABC-type multidrug transport system permease subunit
MIIANFFVGLIIVTIGVLMVRFNFQITNFFGRDNWIEKKLGGGSLYFVMKFVAIAVILFGLLMMVSFHDNFLRWLFNPILDALNTTV